MRRFFIVFFTVVLSFSIMLPSVFADSASESHIYLGWYYRDASTGSNNWSSTLVSRALSNGFAGSTNTAGYWGWKIHRFNIYRNGNTNSISCYSFKLSWYASEGGQSTIFANVPSNGIHTAPSTIRAGGSSGSLGGATALVHYSAGGRSAPLDGYIAQERSLDFFIVVDWAQCSTSYVTVDLSDDIIALFSGQQNLFMYISNISYFNTNDQYLIPLLQDLVDYNVSINSSVSTLASNVGYLLGYLESWDGTLFANFDFWNTHTDDSGIVVNDGFSSSNWFYAVNQNLLSLGRFFSQQVVMDDKVREGGAYDAYDSISEQSNFGSLSDFASVGTISSWDSSSYASYVHAGLLDWFTSQTASDIDQVASRGLPTSGSEIVQFYPTHLAEIISALGGDSDD